MRLWLIRHGETQANVDGLYSGHVPTPLTARGIEQAQNLHTLLHDVSFDRFYAVNWNGHSIPRDWFLVTASTPFISSLNSMKCFWRLGDATSS